MLSKSGKTALSTAGSRFGSVTARRERIRAAMVVSALSFAILTGCSGQAAVVASEVPSTAASSIPTVTDLPTTTEEPHLQASTAHSTTTPVTSPPPSTTIPLPPTFREDSTHYTTTTSTFVQNSTTGVFVDEHALKMADSLEITVAIADGVGTSGIDVEEAIRRYKESIVVEDRAYAAPGQDWADDIREHYTEELAAKVIADLRELSDQHLRSIGHARYNDEVVSASPGKITISGCIDAIGSKIKNDGDLPITPALGVYARHQIKMSRAADGKWYVNDTSTDRSQRCESDNE